MPHVTSHPPGTFCWFELSTSDQNAAKQFYSSLFGWVVSDTPMGPDAVYTLFRLEGEDAAACCTLQPDQAAHGVPPNWMAYVSVANADETAARAAELGATVVAPPFDVMTYGRMAVIQDPTGALFSIWQPLQHVGTTISGERGTACWMDLNTKDQVRAGEFYGALFGWKMVADKDMAPAKPGDYFHIMNGAEMIGGIAPPSQVDPNAPPHWMIYFDVADIATSVGKATSTGARVYLPPMDLGGGGRIAVLADPQGAAFAMYQAH